MKVNISFNCDNACFEHDPAREIGRILEEISAEIKKSEIDRPKTSKVYDINGNVIGEWNIEGY